MAEPGASHLLEEQLKVGFHWNVDKVLAEHLPPETEDRKRETGRER